VAEAVGEDGQAFGEIFLLGHDVGRDDEFDGGEVPDAADASVDHEIGGILGGSGGHGKNAQADVAMTDKTYELFNGLDSMTVNPAADFVRVGVEGAHQAQTEAFKSAIAQESGAEIADTHEDRLGFVIPAKELLDSGDKLGNAEADAGFAGDAGGGEVFADDDRLKMMDTGQDGARDILVAFGLEHTQELEIGGQALDAGDAGFMDGVALRDGGGWRFGGQGRGRVAVGVPGFCAAGVHRDTGTEKCQERKHRLSPGDAG